MFFCKSKNSSAEPDVFVSGERLQVVAVKYLGVLLDSRLSFKAQVKKVCNRVKFNISNFRFIRHYMSTEAANMYMHSMVLSHITYCLTTFSQANATTLKPLQSLYNQTLKILDKKSIRYHHCPILVKYKLLSWDNLTVYLNACLMYKIIRGLTSPPLSQFVSIRTAAYRLTRGAARGDCIIPFRSSAFSQSAFSITAAKEWNSIPISIRELPTYSAYRANLKNC